MTTSILKVKATGIITEIAVAGNNAQGVLYSVNLFLQTNSLSESTIGIAHTFIITQLVISLNKLSTINGATGITETSHGLFYGDHSVIFNFEKITYQLPEFLYCSFLHSSCSKPIPGQLSNLQQNYIPLLYAVT